MTGLYTHALPAPITPQTVSKHRNLWVYGSKKLYCVLDEHTEGTFEGVGSVHEAKLLCRKHGMPNIKLYVSFAPLECAGKYAKKEYIRMWNIKLLGDDLPKWILKRYYGITVQS